MRTGFTTMATPELDVFAAIDAAKSFGFNAIDLRMKTKTGEIDADISPECADKIKKHLEDITLSSILCYNRMVHDGVEAFRDSVISCAETAKLLGALSIRIFTGKITDEKELKSAAEAISGALAAVTDIDIYVQNHANNGVTAIQAAELYKTIGSDRFGLIFSPEQSVMGGEDLQHAISAAAPVCKQLYVADINQNHEYVIPGQGIMPFKDIYRTLKGCGFDGFVTLKWEKCWFDSLPPYKTAFKAFLELIENIKHA